MTKRRLTFTLRESFVMDTWGCDLTTLQTASCGCLDGAPEATYRNYYGAC
jgi:hypothetical protein